MSYFNDDQRSHVAHLASLPTERKCECGWYAAGQCVGCNTKAMERAGGKIVIDPLRSSFPPHDRPFRDYVLPDESAVTYPEMVAWLRSHAKT